MLGTIGEGHKVAFNILNLGRVKLGTRNSAGIRLALNQSIAYARERRQFGKAICEFGLVKQKLAEMTVRCFVSEAMVYRTLGDVDRALEAVDPADAAGVLKAIEAFAVECSINKVATSEALAYAVDEAVQVFGGNGYSREFPVERAYRDARITRIYEGTNEINRLIIPTRLLKHAESLLTHEVTAEATGSRARSRASGSCRRQAAGADGAGDGGEGVRGGGPRPAGGAGARRRRRHRVLRDRECTRPGREDDRTRQRARARSPWTSLASTRAMPWTAWPTPASRSSMRSRDRLKRIEPLARRTRASERASGHRHGQRTAADWRRGNRPNSRYPF